MNQSVLFFSRPESSLKEDDVACGDRANASRINYRCVGSRFMTSTPGPEFFPPNVVVLQPLRARSRVGANHAQGKCVRMKENAPTVLLASQPQTRMLDTRNRREKCC